MIISLRQKYDGYWSSLLSMIESHHPKDHLLANRAKYTKELCDSILVDYNIPKELIHNAVENLRSKTVAIEGSDPYYDAEQEIISSLKEYEVNNQ